MEEFEGIFTHGGNSIKGPKPFLPSETEQNISTPLPSTRLSYPFFSILPLHGLYKYQHKAYFGLEGGSTLFSIPLGRN